MGDWGLKGLETVKCLAENGVEATGFPTAGTSGDYGFGEMGVGDYEGSGLWDSE